MKSLFQGALALILVTGSTATPGGSVSSPLTVNDARALPTSQLAKELLGERLASRVIEARRYEYEGTAKIPQYVEFFTQPELPIPAINGICRTDVITVEYNWSEQESADASTPLKIARVAAKSRYLAFEEPRGEPGSEAYSRAHVAACASMKSISDSFRAPSGGDAQWLTAIRAEYLNPASTLNFSCKDFADRSCAKAREALRGLTLNLANVAERIDCPKVKTGDQVNYCYRLTFPYASTERHPDVGDYADFENDPEWILTVFAGMRDGMAAIKIRSLRLAHLPRSIGIP